MGLTSMEGYYRGERVRDIDMSDIQREERQRERKSVQYGNERMNEAVHIIEQSHSFM